ncbi:transcription initiation factor TFIIIB [Virgibacillus phasianinus]|uniref:Transcription initiation factor TFIIIB n=1 Tax=Virgibacillus phasianinus TaxID=2017483 RepID=A0A220U8Q7_9BACI|nr:transcription initiation factor TFIIIB [Virgibacillus phasianinus]
MKGEIECPKCGGRDFGIGKQKGYAKMSSGRFNLGSNIIHRICTNCGFIAESYAEKPRNFR